MTELQGSHSIQYRWNRVLHSKIAQEHVDELHATAIRHAQEQVKGGYREGELRVSIPFVGKKTAADYRGWWSLNSCK
jgi:hypothetical protein